MKSRRRVHRKKNYTKNKTRRGAGFRDIFHTITGTSSVKPYKSEPIKTYTDKELVNRFKQRLAKKDDDEFHNNLQSELEIRQAIVGYPEEDNYPKLEDHPSMSAGRSRRRHKKRSYRRKH